MNFTKLVLLTTITAALSAPVHGGDWEDYTLASLINREMTFFGVDADVKRLLADKDFENDVRQWWVAVNPAYVQDAVRGARSP